MKINLTWRTRGFRPAGNQKGQQTEAVLSFKPIANLVNWGITWNQLWTPNISRLNDVNPCKFLSRRVSRTHQVDLLYSKAPLSDPTLDPQPRYPREFCTPWERSMLLPRPLGLHPESSGSPSQTNLPQHL